MESEKRRQDKHFERAVSHQDEIDPAVRAAERARDDAMDMIENDNTKVVAMEDENSTENPTKTPRVESNPQVAEPASSSTTPMTTSSPSTTRPSKRPAEVDIKDAAEERLMRPEASTPENGAQAISADMNAVDVTEIYSPPRIAPIAARRGLVAGSSMDLTVTNPASGKPWDFSKADMRRRAKLKIKKEEPYVLITSPMCTAYSEAGHTARSRCVSGVCQPTS